MLAAPIINVLLRRGLTLLDYSWVYIALRHSASCLGDGSNITLPAATNPKASIGLLPFRVWQIFDAMVESLKNGKVNEFLAAAGKLC
jgi:hypothetical protein